MMRTGYRVLTGVSIAVLVSLSDVEPVAAQASTALRLLRRVTGALRSEGIVVDRAMSRALEAAVRDLPAAERGAIDRALDRLPDRTGRASGRPDPSTPTPGSSGLGRWLYPRARSPSGLQELGPLSSRTSFQSRGELEIFLLSQARVPVPAAQEIVSAFESTQPVELVRCTETTQLQRLFGGDARASGRWLYADTMSGSPARLAVPPANTLDGLAVVEVSEGALFLRGRAAPLFGLPGGGTQYFALTPERLRVVQTFVRKKRGRVAAYIVGGALAGAAASAVTTLVLVRDVGTSPKLESRLQTKHLTTALRELAEAAEGRREVRPAPPATAPP